MNKVEKIKEEGLISIPGALTPTECKQAYKNGADIIKLFPATIDKVDYIINITRPLSHIPFMCVGGTNVDTIELFFKAGAMAVGTGLSILQPDCIANDDYAKITELAKMHVEKIRKCK